MHTGFPTRKGAGVKCDNVTQVERGAGVVRAGLERETERGVVTASSQAQSWRAQGAESLGSIACSLSLSTGTDTRICRYATRLSRGGGWGGAWVSITFLPSLSAEMGIRVCMYATRLRGWDHGGPSSALIHWDGC